MKRGLRCFFILLIQVSTLLYLSNLFAQETLREKIRERRKERIRERRGINAPEENRQTGSGDRKFSIMHQGKMRDYFVHIPPSYKSDTPVPVVLNFHGGGGNAQNQVRQSGMEKKSDEAGFILVYPEGSGKMVSGQLVATWNAGRCCGTAARGNVDDVGFISKLIDDLASKFNIDKKRVYATGISNGALISYRLACELSDKIAAIAPVSAQDAFDNCKPSRPISIIHFHGTADPAAAYTGGHCGGRMPGDPGWDCSSVKDYIEEWRGIDNCPSQSSVTYQKGEVTCITYGPCDRGTEITLCTIEGGGHTWPSGTYAKDTESWKKAVGKINYDINANDAMWEFFKKHSLEN